MADNISAWERVKLARDSKRPTSLDYIDNIFDLFLEFHGDRLFRDDKAIVGGVALINDIPVTVIGQQKGKNVEENLTRNFGMPYPEGYRKALRLMKQAEKFHRPIICFIDTPGAFCGVEAEERGQGEAIARNLFEMAGIKVPILSILIGEGGSGGALALGVANEVWMLENSIYSILSPEGFASILYKDSKRASEAAGVMKITANDLKNLHIVERVFVEEKEIAIKQESSKQDNSKHENTKQDNSKQDNSKQKNNKQVLNTENYNILTDKLKQSILSFIDKYKSMSQEAIVEERYQRFREM